MTTRFANNQEILDWNSHIIANPDGGNVFASYEFAMQKETGGYKAYFIFVDNLAITVLEKSTPLFGKLWYLPKGPGVTSPKELFNVLKSLELFAKKHGVFAIRIESELNSSQSPTLSRHGLIKSNPIIPNPSTITLNIGDDLETIMTNLPQKGRYAIKRAERDGVKVKAVKSTNKNCQQMYRLLSETAEGQFGIRSYDYYKTFWQRFETANLGQMFFAYFEDKVVAGAYVMVYGQKSTYKDGASVRKRTAYGASHLLQWHVIEWAKSRGSKVHDLCGSPPSNQINNPDHRHYGIGLFKTAFSKNVIDYIGCYDYVIDHTKYKIWINLLEKVAKRLHYYKHHDSYF
jgi:lipid II:glycine glycyltransferase (peptidoglycan interpeptide bridge formation enzyme)